MEFFRFQDCGKIRHRHAPDPRRQELIEVVFETHAHAGRSGSHPRGIAFDARLIDDGGALPPEVVKRGMKEGNNLRIDVVTLVGFAQHAYANAFQTIAIQCFLIIWHGMPTRCCRGWVARVFTGDDLEDDGHIRHCPRHRSGDVGPQVEREDPGAAGQAHGRTYPGKGLMRCWTPDGIASVGAKSDKAEVCRDSRCRATARPSRHPVEGVGVFRVAGQDRTDGFNRAERPFGHV